MSTVLIVGCGYLGRRVARRECEEGNRVLALVRSDGSAAQCMAEAVEARCVDLDAAEPVPALPTRDAVIYYFAPPPATGRTDPRIRRFLADIGRDALPSRVVLVSTSGVYGDCRGAWVDEQRPPQPDAERAKRPCGAGVNRTAYRW
jgi:nucleoside-diphosphate-sugar epimerase